MRKDLSFEKLLYKPHPPTFKHDFGEKNDSKKALL